MLGGLPSRSARALSATFLLLLMPGCPTPPAPRAAPRAPAAPPVRVLHDFSAPQTFTQLLGVDRQRHEALAFVRSFGSVHPRSPVRLVTVPLAPGRHVTTWTLPRPASALIDQAMLYDLQQAQGKAWLARLLEVIQRLGPWYVSRTPPVLDVSPDGQWIVYADTPDKRAMASPHGGPAQMLNGDSPACYQTTFSPDGRWLAYSCFNRRHKEYCPTLRAVVAPRDAPAAPQSLCSPRGFTVSGPYWQPDSSAFMALVRRGFGAYIDPVHRICLVRVEVSGRAPYERALWCEDLDPERDAHRKFRFRPAPDGRTAVLLIQTASRERCRVVARWLRLSDGEQLAAWSDVPVGIGLLTDAVLSADGRLLAQGCDGGLLALDLKTGRAVQYLRGRSLSGLAWDGGSDLVALEYVPPADYRLLAVDLRRARTEVMIPLDPLGPTSRPDTSR